MAEQLVVHNDVSKEQRYQELLPQLEALVAGESDFIANLSNILAALKTTFNWLWVGVYLVKENELVLGPFQGPIACTRIGYGRGVCGTSWEQKEVLLVPDVDAFPGHIACSSASRSEIVLPVINTSGEVTLVLDIDSDKLNDFDETDKKYLMKIVELINKL
ncbi:MAG: GAF domain-containing protein [Flavobacteriales bacterium]|nr:GAF domain-containing protein [Flavobacteriales bacterium]